MRVTISTKKAARDLPTIDGNILKPPLSSLFKAWHEVSTLSTDIEDRATFPGLVCTFNNPETFQRVMLDMMAVLYHPYPFGSLLLTGNPGLILGAVPSESFRLFYGTATGGKDDSINAIHRQMILPQYEQAGLSFDKASGVFVAVTSSSEREKVMLEGDSDSYRAGMGRDELFDRLGGQQQEEKRVSNTGFTSDPDMVAGSVRISLLTFHKL